MKDSIAIILVAPQLGENIGAAARVMLNFGLTDLRIVNPRDGWPNPVAADMAKGAKELIYNAQIFDELEDAIGDINKLYATTARVRGMIKPEIVPSKCAEDIVDNIRSGDKCAIMFGPERTGLSNDEVVLADAITIIPVAPIYTSLNLAQAVGVICYELYLKNNEVKEVNLPMGNSELATKKELTDLFKHLEEELDKTHFFKVDDKRPRMVRNIRNMFMRCNLTDQEVRTLRGIIKSLTNE